MLRPAVLVLAAAVYAAAEPPAGEFCGEPSTKGIVAALETDDFKCALSLIKAVGVDVNVNEVMMGLRSVEGRVKEIKDAVKATQHDPTKFLAPAHQWAQSGGEIFLSVKFAHKWDAPATLVSAEDIEEVAFEAEKVVVKASKAEKRFVLEVPLLREIDPAASSYVTASVGRMTITLKKASAQREWWPRLNKEKTKPANQGVWSPLLHLDGAPASSDLPYPGGEPPRSPPHTGPHTTNLQPETAASLQEKHRRAMTPGSNRDFVSKQEAARWAAAAAAAAVMGLSLDAIAGLAAPPAALGEPGGPLLHPLHVKQRGRPSFPANQPDLKPAPNGAPLTKQTYVTPPNQLILASYPNGRPGALRALQRAPSAAQVPDDYGAAEDVMRVSLSRKTIARAPIGRRDDDGLDPASWDGAN